MVRAGAEIGLAAGLEVGEHLLALRRRGAVVEQAPDGRGPPRLGGEVGVPQHRLHVAVVEPVEQGPQHAERNRSRDSHAP